MKSYCSVLICILFCFGSREAQKTKISVYYESLCPDSIAFITKELYPTYRLLESDLDIDLVPFGFATAQNVSGNWTFTCQHGPNECVGNLYHSCAISLFTVMESVSLVDCFMSSNTSDTVPTLEKCSTLMELSWADLSNCYESGKGDELLVANGNRTAAVVPPITWIPTVVFDGIYNQTLQDRAQEDLLRVLCDIMAVRPIICPNGIGNDR